LPLSSMYYNGDKRLEGVNIMGRKALTKKQKVLNLLSTGSQ